MSRPASPSPAATLARPVRRGPESSEHEPEREVEQREERAVHVREPGLEVLADGVAVDPGVLVGCEVAQVDEQEAVEHEARHHEQADADVVASGLHGSSLLAATEVLHEQHEVGPVVGRHGVGHVRGEQHGVRRVDAEMLGPGRHGAGALERLDDDRHRRVVLGQRGPLAEHDGDELERGLIDEDTNLARLTRSGCHREFDGASDRTTDRGRGRSRRRLRGAASQGEGGDREHW
jgi:hypothetical protein